jgi:hypothetical protein
MCLNTRACETNKNTTTTTRKTVQEAARGVGIKTAILLKCNVVPIKLNLPGWERAWKFKCSKKTRDCKQQSVSVSPQTRRKKLKFWNNIKLWPLNWCGKALLHLKSQTLQTLRWPLLSEDHKHIGLRHNVGSPPACATPQKGAGSPRSSTRANCGWRTRDAKASLWMTQSIGFTCGAKLPYFGFKTFQTCCSSGTDADTAWPRHFVWIHIMFIHSLQHVTFRSPHYEHSREHENYTNVFFKAETDKYKQLR